MAKSSKAASALVGLVTIHSPALPSPGPCLELGGRGITPTTIAPQPGMYAVWLSFGVIAVSVF